MDGKNNKILKITVDLKMGTRQRRKDFELWQTPGNRKNNSAPFAIAWQGSESTGFTAFFIG